MNLLSRLPIRFQLRLIVMIMALPVVGILINTGIHDRKEALSVAKKDTQKLAERIAYEQQNLVASARQLMASLSQLPEIKQKKAARVTSILKEIHTLNPDFTNIFVADSSGTVWATAVPVKPPFSVSDRRYFKNTLATGQLSSGEHIVAKAGNRSSFTLGYPIKDEKGNITGVIAIGFLLEKYTQLLERNKLPIKASFVLLDHKGTFLYRALESENFIGKQSDPELFKQVQEGPDESTYVGTAMSTGDERIISTRKLRLEGEQAPYMYVRVGIPVGSALASANTQFLRNLIFFSWILIVAFIFSSFVGKRSIVSRIALLEKASKSLADGDLQIRVVDLVKGGELGRLAESLDSMAGKLVQREAALLKSEERFRSFVENANDIVFSLSTEGVFTYVSPNWKDAFGYELDETIGKPFILFVHPDDVATCFAALQKTLETGEKQSGIEYRVLCRDGTLIWYSANGALLHDTDKNEVSFLGIGRDISERKNAEKALRESEEQLKTSEENYRRFAGLTSDYVHKCSRTGAAPFRIQWIGGSIDSISGYTAEEIFAMGCWLPIVHPDDRQEVATYLFSLVPGDLKQKEFRITAKGGQIRWISETASCKAGDSEGELVLFGAAKDVTERKLAEEERDQLAKQLLHAQKLESLGVLAGGIAHDFNNILTSIVGNADLALMRVSKESPAIDNLHKIEHAASRAADLAKQMLAYSGKGQFVIENLDMNRLLQEMLHMLEVSISKKVELRLKLTPNLPAVEADATQIQQIIMNLVINASEAIGDANGAITINTGFMNCDKKYLKNFWQDKNIRGGLYVYLEITDTGCGMDKETLDRIFDPFFTTKFTGRGLGMAAVHGIIRGHKGAINVYSEPNKGTSFKVFLPASGKPFEIVSRDSKHDSWKGKGTVLLVDDEETVRDIGKEMLRELGFSTVTANDGNEALEAFTSAPDISFVILDLTMPHMDGEQCFRKLREIKPDIKVFISSGFSEQEVTQKFIGTGLAGFIQKPYRLGVLKETIRMAI